MKESQINFKSLAAALSSFNEAIETKTKSVLERDGTIQRFEYTFELCWKSIRKLLLEMGRNDTSSSPKPLLRDAFEEGLISDLYIWFKFLYARNRTSHTYNLKTADEVYNDILDFGIQAQKLLDNLNKKLKELYE